jgi:molybdate transport system substrate-binding protein
MASGNSPSLSILCTLGLRGVMTALEDELAARGLPFRAHYESTKAIMARLATGERADLALLLSGTVEELTAAGTLIPGSRRDLARSGVAIAVKAGAPKPDISTVEALKRTLLAAPSIAYTKSGASGIHFAAVIDQLGIADQIRPKAKVQDGLVGELAARGEAAMAVQQMSELLPVAGIEIIGPLPDAVQKMSVFSAGIFVGCERPEAARALISFLASREAEPVLRDKGLEPASAFV